MAQENIRFYEYGDGSYNMVDVYLPGRFFGYKYFYKKVTMNILLDIMM